LAEARLVSTGIDVAIRIAAMKDSSLIASTLAPNPRILCASPDYIARRGMPRSVKDLIENDCVTTAGTLHWPFIVEGGERAIRLNPRLTVNNIEGVRDACLAGARLGSCRHGTRGRTCKPDAFSRSILRMESPKH
jgi:DNA-binding transcriptional LysR family regulator